MQKEDISYSFYILAGFVFLFMIFLAIKPSETPTGLITIPYLDTLSSSDSKLPVMIIGITLILALGLSFVSYKHFKKKKQASVQPPQNTHPTSTLSSNQPSTTLLSNDELKALFSLRKKQEGYLSYLMKRECPNLAAVAGVLIGAKLISIAGSLERLARFPASTVQILGAETAFFRFLRNRRNSSPKYGVIINHPLIQNAKRDKRGKAARMLADKLSLCARLDFFKGEFKAPDYRIELERKLQ